MFGGIIYWAIKTRCTCYRTRYKRSFKESGIKPRYSIASGNHLPPEISEISTVPDVPTVSEVYSIEGHLRTSKTRVRNHDNNLSAYIYSNHARKSCWLKSVDNNIFSWFRTLSKTNFAKTVKNLSTVQPPSYDDIIRMYYK